MIRDNTKNLPRSNLKLLGENTVRVSFCMPQIPRVFTSEVFDITSLPTKANN